VKILGAGWLSSGFDHELKNALDRDEMAKRTKWTFNYRNNDADRSEWEAVFT
jgi:hypothetical protein